MDISITVGHDDSTGINVEISDERDYTPEIVSDILRRAADTALRLHRELHPATDGA